MRYFIVFAAFGGMAGLTAAQAPSTEIWSEKIRLDAGGLQVWCVTYSADSKRLAAGSGETLTKMGELKVWDSDTGKVLFAVKTAGAVRCVAFAPDGKTLADAEQGVSALLRDAATGEVRTTFTKPKTNQANIQAMCFTGDGKMLATAGIDRTIRLWDTATGEEVRVLTGHTAPILALAFGGEGVLASGGQDGAIKIWQPATGDNSLTLPGHRTGVQGLAFAPDGKTLASCGSDKGVKLWDLASGKLFASLSGHNDGVLALAISPNGKTLASSSGPGGRLGPLPAKAPVRGDIILWDLEANKARTRMTLPDRAFGMAFAPDGNTLVLTGMDGALSLWKPDNGGGLVQGKDSDKDEQNRRSEPLEEGEAKFTFSLGFGTRPKSPDFKTNYAKEYLNPLKGKLEKNSDLMIYGPEAKDRLTFESAGLHINLPAGYAKPRPGTGLVTDFGVRGDFEITVNYEILQATDPLKAGKPTELSLVVVPYDPAKPDVWHKANQNRASLSRQTASRVNDSQFLTSLAKWNEAIVKDKWGNEIWNNKETFANTEIATDAKAGRLRLVRQGSTLYFFGAEGPTQDFVLLDKEEFGNKDVKNVRILGSTGGPGTWLDVRVTDFAIRADDLPKDLTAIGQPAAGRGWLALSIGLILLTAITLGILLFTRQRRQRPSSVAAPLEEKPLMVAFSCGACEKRLKAKTELAGKKIKCPGCGQAVQVPFDTEEQS